MANLKGKHFAICGLFCALLAISSKIQIPTPLIPLTMQTATLFLCILILPNFLSFFTAIVYLITGLIGLPIFAQGGGFSYLLNPTFGYLLGFLFSALIKGIFFKKERLKNSLFKSYSHLLEFSKYTFSNSFCFLS